MKQRFTSLFILTLVCAMVWAGPVGLEQARGKAAKFFKEQNRGAKLATDTPEYAPARTIRGVMSKTETPAYYVFNAEDELGYVIVSGDDNTDDILGYSMHGTFDLENVPENVKAWLQGYAEQIALMEAYSTQSNDSRHDEEKWDAITPMLSTKWNQNAPYNNKCPIDYDTKSVTGCTATAMAQLMKYHEWPQDSCARIPGYTTQTSQLRLPALLPIAFAWNEMKDAYSYSASEDESEAAAMLMRYCGQAIKSDYTKMSTGAYPFDVAYALEKYFDYDHNIQHKYLHHYSISEWESIIYEELKANRPILHAGYSMGGGHAFVCDGYDGNGMFHFNWGWGGTYDGFFKLALMNPQSGETGSGSDDGYSGGQEILLGIQPPTGEEEIPRYFEPSDEQFQGEYMFSYFFNTHHKEVTANVGFATVNKDNEIMKVVKDCGPLTLAENTSEGKYVSLNIKEDNIFLTPGTHRIATVCRAEGTNQWKRVGSSQKYFILKVTTNSRVTEISLAPEVDVEILGLRSTGNLVAGMPQNLMLSLENKGGEFYSYMYLFASRTEDKGNAQSRATVILKEKEKTELPLTFTPDSAGKLHIYIAQDQYCEYIVTDTVLTIKAAPQKPSSLTLLSCIPDKDEVSAKVRIKNNSSEPYYRGIVALFYENLYNDGRLYNTETLELPGNIEPGRFKTLDFKFRGANSHNQCAILICYYKNHTDDSYTQLGDFVYFVTGETAVESIEGTTVEGDTHIFRIDGTRVKNSDIKGIYISNGKKLVTQ